MDRRDLTRIARDTLIVALLLLAAYAAGRGQAETRVLRVTMLSTQIPHRTTRVDFAELDGLPPPVQRYFRTVLQEGEPIVTGVRLEQTGTLDIDDSGNNGGSQWRPFRAEQLVLTSRPAFDWNARVTWLPGIAVRMHEAYVAGHGVLRESMLGVIVLVDARDATALADGELGRFVTDAVWYPTALLPSQGVRWQPVDDESARATLNDGRRIGVALFHFDSGGLIDWARIDARPHRRGATIVASGWERRCTHYEPRDGMRIPLDCTAAWLGPDGPRVAWRGRVTVSTYTVESTPRE